MTIPHRRTAGAVLALAASVALIQAGPAHASSSRYYYSSCTNLHHVYKHGVSKSKAAAQKQVRAGYGMPAYGSTAQKVYWENYKRLDRDRDGTACEA